MKKLVIFLLLVFSLSACSKECDDLNMGDICFNEDGSTYAYNLTLDYDSFDMYQRVQKASWDGFRETGVLFESDGYVYKRGFISETSDLSPNNFLYKIDGEYYRIDEVFAMNEELFYSIIDRKYPMAPAEFAVYKYPICDDGLYGHACILEDDGLTHAYEQHYPYEVFPKNYYQRVDLIKSEVGKDWKYYLIHSTEEKFYISTSEDDLNHLYVVEGNFFTLKELAEYDTNLFQQLFDTFDMVFTASQGTIPDLESGEEWCFSYQMDEPFCVIGK